MLCCEYITRKSSKFGEVNLAKERGYMVVQKSISKWVMNILNSVAAFIIRIFCSTKCMIVQQNCNYII